VVGDDAAGADSLHEHVGVRIDDAVFAIVFLDIQAGGQNANNRHEREPDDADRHGDFDHGEGPLGAPGGNGAINGSGGGSPPCHMERSPMEWATRDHQNWFRSILARPVVASMCTRTGLLVQLPGGFSLMIGELKVGLPLLSSGSKIPPEVRGIYWSFIRFP